jgi:RNA polymerase sigma-70 factor (ECF subfamily)
MRVAAVIGITEANTRRIVCPPSLVIRKGVLKDLEPDAVEPFVTPAPADEAGGPARGTPEEELALIRRTARGDRAAFKALYDRYAPKLGRYILRLIRRRETVGEVVNDVMLVAWQSAARFDPDAARLSSWLFGIAHNKALKALERMGARKGEVALDTDAGEDIAPSDEVAPRTPEEAAIGRQAGAALLSALERLSPNHRAVIELAFAEDCSYQEIAEITGCPVNTVKTRMFHARKQLARLLDGGADR